MKKFWRKFKFGRLKTTQDFIVHGVLLVAIIKVLQMLFGKKKSSGMPIAMNGRSTPQTIRSSPYPTAYSGGHSTYSSAIRVPNVTRFQAQTPAVAV